jgi:cytochrome c
MFDTMTLTKIAGGVLSAFLFLLLGNWAASSFYSMEAGHGDGHGEEHASGYHIAVGGDDHAEEEEVEEVSVADILAAGDAAKGAKVFAKCKACHKLEDGANGTGPYLTGIVGRDVGVATGFGYSDAILALEGAWTEEALYEFLANPKGYAPGNKMSFVGLKKETDRANLIAYLATVN